MSERRQQREKLAARQAEMQRAAQMQANRGAGLPDSMPQKAMAEGQRPAEGEGGRSFAALRMTPGAQNDTALRMTPGAPQAAGRQPAMAGPNIPDPRLDAEARRLDRMAGAAEERRIPEEHAYRTAEEAEAFRLGEKIGAASIAGSMEPMIPPDRGVNEEKLIEAEKLLMDYKAGKSSVERRIINAQQWWKMRNWEQIEHQKGIHGAREIKSATAWLWNCIIGKHAESMESFPEPVVLPRMQEDKDEAQILSDIIPVILKINGFEEQYSMAQWQKFQEGTGAYYIGWDKTKLGGLGDICIRNVSLLNMFWEPGIEDIQESENLFFVQLVNSKRLEEQYPQLKGKLQNAYLKPAEYRKDDSVSTDGKSVLVDWYYHVWEGERKILHYCQFVGHEILYSTENNGEMDGLYNDGEYPFVLDALYPVHGSPAGYGLIDICADAQTDIDTLNQAMVQNAVVTSTPRFFVQSDGAINEDEFADWSRPFVHAGGGLGDTSIRQIQVSGIQNSALEMLNRKIEEMKFITGNSDVATGATPSGVTAASAIAALQEAHGRSSKDSTKTAYRASMKIFQMTIERIRQFYDLPRQFRILGPNGQQRFVNYTNAKLQEQMMLGGMGLEPGFRKPVFDIDVITERETSYSRISQNELAVQFMQMGVFNPQATDQVLMMLDMMDFRGKAELMEKIEKLGTLRTTLMQVAQIAMALAQKYQPEIAAQLQPVLMAVAAESGGGMQQMMAQGAKPEAVANPEQSMRQPEQTHVENARQRANEAFMPE